MKFEFPHYKLKLSILNLAAILIFVHVELQIIFGYSMDATGFTHYSENVSEYIIGIVVEFLAVFFCWFIGVEKYIFPDYFNSDWHYSLAALRRWLSISNIKNKEVFRTIDPIDVILFKTHLLITLFILLVLTISLLIRLYVVGII